MEEIQKKQIPSYLQHNSWEQELNFKLWVTKGSRFCADKRLQTEGKLSQLALNFLSSYLIIIGLTPLSFSTLAMPTSQSYISLATTAVSIILLVFGLIESAKKHDLKAHHFHECAIKISKIYNRLRQAKSIKTDEERQKVIEDISNEYESILEAYENHEGIDYDMFKTQKSDCFELTESDIRSIFRKYYFKTKFMYHLLMIAPIFCIVGMLVLSIN